MARVDVARSEKALHRNAALVAAALLMTVLFTITLGGGRSHTMGDVMFRVANRVATHFAAYPPPAPAPPPAPPPPAPPLVPSELCLVQLSNYVQGSENFADLSQMWWYAYAQKHGYRYMRVLDAIPQNEEDPWGPSAGKCFVSWHKVVTMKHLLPQCELLALLDLDVIVSNMSIPLLDVLVHEFNFKEPSVMAMSSDPDAEHNYVTSPIDNKRRLFENTGFVVLRNRPRTYEILTRWLNCTQGGSPGCEAYFGTWPCDQGAWAMYIRPTVLDSDITVLPCTHFNAWPGADPKLTGPNCDPNGGRVLQHYWLGQGALTGKFESWATEHLGSQDPAARQQLLSEVSEEKGTLIKLTPDISKASIGRA